MAQLNDRVSRLSDWSRVFVLETFASFGLATILRAAMAPPALCFFVSVPPKWTSRCRAANLVYAKAV